MSDEAHQLLANTRRKALEEAAKVCDDYPLRDPAEDGNGYWAAENCAQAIRSMIEQPAPPLHEGMVAVPASTLQEVLNELEWYVARKKNLADLVEEFTERTWADAMSEDLEPLRAMLAERGRKA